MAARRLPRSLPTGRYGRAGRRRAARYPRKRRSTGRKRTYRKRTMTRRSILNVTSEKKRDKMLQITNSTAVSQSGSGTYLSQSRNYYRRLVYVAAFVWCATARDNTRSSTATQPGNKFDDSTRTASSCYMVGLKETIELQCPDGLPWQWRRICVTMKGTGTFAGTLNTGTSTFYTALETSNGFSRVLNQILAADRLSFYGTLFQGQQDVDWADPMTAKVDNERLTVKYDKTITLASGNDDGMIRKYSRYHRMGHNLEYNDDESGGTKTAGQFSVTSKKGMGDYWVIDLFRPRVGSTASNQMLFGTESTLYWHER
ncbi:capsid protein [Fur seal associated gemycircularvirus 1]|uniref:Capsid protein n=1 Tax=Fur seal associated gemycircularvirus 1 TaxID=1985380 RepID=T1YRY1_9VIRU|nr:capsid protein [Fur seal associated gemycircularvirus 1]AGU67662.1 capsid protein [Fur seal associated gemycircularvirus 1]